MIEHWISTVVEQHHFPFFEFICIMFLGMLWSIIYRLKRIENNQEREFYDYD